jgi:hypothetical protein
MKKIAIAYLIIIIFLASGELFAQSIVNPFHVEKENQFQVGMDKMASTYLFLGNFYLEYELWGGRLKLNQNYAGDGILSSRTFQIDDTTTKRISEIVFQDDEKFDLEYSLPLYEKIELVIRNNTTIFNERSDGGLGDLHRLSGLAGIRYLLMDDSHIELVGGAENRYQQGINSTGPVISLWSKFNEIKFDQYKINSSLIGEHIKHNYDRESSDLLFRSNFKGLFDTRNSLLADLTYKYQVRDNLVNFAGDSLSKIYTNSRDESRIIANLQMNFSLNESLGGLTRIYINDAHINRGYKSFNPDVISTGVENTLHELQLSLQGEANLRLDKLAQDVGVIFYLRNENNDVRNKYGISEEEEELLRQKQNILDNESTRTKFYTRTDWLLTKNDSLLIDYAVSLYTYDTPSEQNEYDRDEFNTYLKIKYGRKFSRILTAALNAEVQMTHSVNLKSSQSASNNWNRIFRFGPEVRWKTKNFMINPKIEVLANYTVYDFGEIGSGINSYSFRQLSYKDSLFVNLGKMISLQSQIKLYFSERGILYWDSFAEAPETRKVDFFAKLLLFKEFSEMTSVACGLRYFSLTEKNLILNTGRSSLDYRQKTYAPEALIQFKFESGSRVTFQGWYEFRKVNSNKIEHIPNFYIKSYLFL